MWRNEGIPEVLDEPKVNLNLHSYSKILPICSEKLAIFHR